MGAFNAHGLSSLLICIGQFLSYYQRSQRFPAAANMNILEWAFGKRMTPAERLRKNQRMLDKAIRELDQTRVKLKSKRRPLSNRSKRPPRTAKWAPARSKPKTSSERGATLKSSTGCEASSRRSPCACRLT